MDNSHGNALGVSMTPLFKRVSEEQETVSEDEPGVWL
jgi:hypothetical protein